MAALLESTLTPGKSRVELLLTIQVPLPSVVPPGPDNPLGAFALTLSLPTYLIHGTNKPDGVGMRSSHGCIRL
jgi:lipoprotein-anchoring transpeptidase ErfK/SrfK